MLEQEIPLSFMSSYNVLLPNEGYNLAMFGIIVTSLNRTSWHVTTFRMTLQKFDSQNYLHEDGPLLL